MKKITAYLLCAAMLGSYAGVAAAETSASLPAFVSAAEQQTNGPTTGQMEAMIKKVKPKLDIPDQAEVFEWDYDAGNYANDAQWTFSWSTQDSDLSYRVRATNDGVITYYYMRDNRQPYSYLRFPNYKKAQLEPKAKEFVKKLVPEIYDSLVLSNEGSDGIYSNQYNYRFVRNENNVIFPQDTVNVSVNNITGEVVNFNSNYHVNIDIPSAEGVIGEQKAKEILGTKLGMVLSYRIKDNYDTLDQTKSNVTEAYLVYTPVSGYLSVDAKTGEIYTQNFSWDERNSSDDAFASVNGAMKDMVTSESSKAEQSEYELNEKELEQLEILASLITKEQAIQTITSNEYLYIDPNLTAVTATLNKRQSYDYTSGTEKEQEKYYWNISFSNPKPKSDNGYDYSYANATVDAQDASLVSFSSSLRDYYYYENNKLSYPEINYTDDWCRATAEEFLKGQIADKFENSRLADTNPTNVIEYKSIDDKQVAVYGAYSYNYVRVNEGIDFNYNNIRVGVDGVSGKIFRYNYNWYDNVSFESPGDAITEEAAREIYLGQEGFGLNYELFSRYIYNKYLEQTQGEKQYIDYDSLYDAEFSARLIYSAYNIKCSTVGALSGKLLNYNGGEYVPVEPFAYNDIDGHWAQDTIELFADVSVGFEGESFLPDQKITAQEFNELSQMAGLYLPQPEQKQQKDAEENTHITRIEAVKSIIDSLGYAKIAALEDVFSVSYDDESEIGKENMGYAALARGLKIAVGDNNLFRPNQSLTRAEAITLLRNALCTAN